MRKVCVKMVLKVLSKEQKLSWVKILQEILDCMQEDKDFLNNVITSNESLVFQYDRETKCESSEWHTQESPSLKKARMSKSKIITMLIFFFRLFTRSTCLLE